MAPQVLLTIDTELVWRHHAAGLDAATVIHRSIDPAGVGLDHQLAMLARYGLKACFFVDPMPALVVGIGAIRAIVERILAAGQEVQLHLHPNWTGASLVDRSASAAFELCDYPPDRQQALIAEAAALLVAAGAPPPIAFRAGSFAANDATLDALAALGFRFDSSHNGSHAPHPSAIALPPTQIAPVVHRGIIEVPVTQFEDRPGRLRHCQLTAISVAEMAAVLDHAATHRHPLVTFVSHSFELASRNGRRANRILTSRFAALCALLADRADRTPTSFFRDIDPPFGVAARPLVSSLSRTAARLVTQTAANMLYEVRP